MRVRQPADRPGRSRGTGSSRSGRRRGRRRLAHHGGPLLVAAVVVSFIAVQLWWSRTPSNVLYLSADATLDALPRPGDALDASLWPGAGLEASVAPVAAAPAPSTTRAASSTPTISLPVPAPLPADPYADTPDVLVGTISIPAIGLEEPLHQGMTLTAINRGPSQWPGTAEPGQLGNMVIAGHRTTYSHPFRDLDQLQPGDQVVYRSAAGTFTYAVTSTEIVTPEQVQIADQTVGYTATLFACHPPGSAAYRIVTHLQLLDESGRPKAPPNVSLSPVTIPRG